MRHAHNFFFLSREASLLKKKMIIIHRNPSSNNQQHPVQYLFHPAGLFFQNESPRLENGNSSTEDNAKDAGGEPHQKRQLVKTPNISERQIQNAAAHEIDVPMHIEQNEDAIILQLDVPGFNGNDLNVVFENGVLSIAGTRCNKFGYSAKFARRFPLEDSRIQTENISADLSDCVLTITFPKKQVTQRRVIPITENDGRSEEANMTEDREVKSKTSDTGAWNSVVKSAEEEISVETVDEKEAE